MPFFGTKFSSSFCKHVQTCHIKVSQVSDVTELVTELVGFVRRNALASPGNLPWRRTEALRFALRALRFAMSPIFTHVPYRALWGRTGALQKQLAHNYNQ